MATVVTRAGRDGKPRYDVRYRDPAGVQRKRTFTKKADATAYSVTVEADKLRGAYSTGTPAAKCSRCTPSAG